jgi:hypothetical protein
MVLPPLLTLIALNMFLPTLLNRYPRVAGAAQTASGLSVGTTLRFLRRSWGHRDG